MTKIERLSINELFTYAIQNHQKNNFKVAEDLYNKVIKIDPNYKDAHYNLGIMFQSLGSHQKAITSYEKTIEIDPNYKDAHNNLGIILQELGKYQEALTSYEKAIEIDPSFKDAQFNLGIVFQSLGSHQKAITSYEKTIEIDPNYKSAHNNLGTILQELGKYQEALTSYEKAIEIDHSYIDAHNNLGTLYKILGKYEKEFISYMTAIAHDSNNIISINNLSKSLQRLKLDNESKINKTHLKKLILLLLKKDNINHNDIFYNAKSILFIDIDDNQLKKDIDLGFLLLSNQIVKDLLKQQLFHLMLQKSLIVDEFFEKLLTKLRCEILFTISEPNKNILREYFDFIISSAEQSWLNEYVYIQSEKEASQIEQLKYKVENNKEINELEIAILGCYIPLNSSKIIINKLLNHKSSNILFNDLINLQIKEPLREIELTKSIKSLDVIEDPTSKKVRDQYEENPYPRWRYTNILIPNNFFKWINAEILPNIIEYNNDFDKPNILIAGCGTGSHSISAMRYKNAKILGVDLSLASLAYAKRKTEELNIKNIEYLQADILQLKKLDKKFDIIESSGVLHHMKDPIAGLKVLLDLLEPNGFLKLGLYSKIGRRHIVEAREVFNKKNVKNINKDFKIFRQEIINEKKDLEYRKLVLNEDFYSLSGLKDLLFHVQEYCFTIPEISKMLNNLNLKFIGFYVSDNFIKNKYSKLYPDDEKNISLNNWHQFEINNPDTFASMYQLWVQKT